MGQMGLLTPTTSFYSAAARWDPDNFAPHHGLLQLAIGSGGASSYRAPLDDRHPGLLQWIPFVEWWSEVVIDDRKGNRLTRKELVLALANKEGGAHVDPALTPSYEALRGSPFWVVESAHGTKPLAGRVELFSMRQVAHELLRTLEQAGYS